MLKKAVLAFFNHALAEVNSDRAHKFNEFALVKFGDPSLDRTQDVGKRVFQHPVRALLIVLVCSGPVMADGPATGSAGGWGPFGALPREIPDYRPYFYNYPHAIPPDYVFRTARVFPPREMDKSMLAAMFASRNEGRGEGGAGTAVNLPRRINLLARELIANAAEPLADEYVVAVSTFVSLDNLYATSSFGRYLGEQMLSSLQQAGLEVVEVRKTPGLLISPDHGEYALSRSMDEISLIQNAQAVVVGTYKVAGQEVFVNARLLRNDDNRVLASADMALPLDRVSAGLLANESAPRSLRSSQVVIRQFPEQGKSVAAPQPAAKKKDWPAVKNPGK